MKKISKILPRGVFATLPFVLGVLLVLLAVLPVRMPVTGTHIGPLIVLTVIFHSAVKYPSLLPSFAVFLLGLGFDMLSSGPLGFWALIYLACHMISSHQKTLLGKEKLLTSVLAFAVIACVCAFLSWGLGSIFYGQIAPYKETVFGVLTAVLIYPLTYFFLLPVDRRFYLSSLQGFGRA